MMHISPFTAILDALGIAGILVGGYVAIKSTYLRENTKDAAILIDTQRKRIDSLEQAVNQMTKTNEQLQKDIHMMSGELAAYKKLSYIEPTIITKLSTTMDTILSILQKDGIHISTQQVDKQVIKESK